MMPLQHLIKLGLHVIPTLSNVAMASSNGVNPAFAKADDIITITFNSNETLKFTDADGDGVVDADATEPLISILEWKLMVLLHLHPPHHLHLHR